MVGIEIDRGLMVTSLLAAGYEVYAVNPMASSRYRDRHVTSGAKSDPGRRQGAGRPGAHRPAQPPPECAGDSELRRGDQAPRPGPPESHLGSPAPGQRAAHALQGVLPRGPCGLRDRPRTAAMRWRSSPSRRPPSSAGRLSRSKIAAALRRGGRTRNVERRSEEIQVALRVEQLARRPLVESPRLTGSYRLGTGPHRELQRRDRRARSGAVGEF